MIPQKRRIDVVENQPELRILIFSEHHLMRNPGQRSAQIPSARQRDEIGQLRQENEMLREEVLQLTAAVSIFRGVAQKLCEIARTAEESNDVAQRVGLMLRGSGTV